MTCAQSALHKMDETLKATAIWGAMYNATVKKLWIRSNRSALKPLQSAPSVPKAAHKHFKFIQIQDYYWHHIQLSSYPILNLQLV